MNNSLIVQLCDKVTSDADRYANSFDVKEYNDRFVEYLGMKGFELKSFNSLSEYCDNTPNMCIIPHPDSKNPFLYPSYIGPIGWEYKNIVA